MKKYPATKAAVTHAAEPATSPGSGDITEPIAIDAGARQLGSSATRRAASVARYFRQSRDRGIREGAPYPRRAPIVAQPPIGAAACTPADKAAATQRALQAAENEGWK